MKHQIIISAILPIPQTLCAIRDRLSLTNADLAALYGTNAELITGYIGTGRWPQSEQSAHAGDMIPNVKPDDLAPAARTSAVGYVIQG